jgi:hypothetical protein
MSVWVIPLVNQDIIIIITSYHNYKLVFHYIIWEILLSLQEEELNIKKILLNGWAKKMTIREGIHISDLVYCRRKVCYSHINLTPQDMSKKKTEVKAHMIFRRTGSSEITIIIGRGVQV